MIYDCFTFFNELEVLRLRLEELWEVVDRFVLVEATVTHAGAPKPLVFADNREAFAPYLSKITHIVVSDMPDGPDPWARECFQRDAIARGLDGVGANDWVIVSDVDEIPRANIVAALPQYPFVAVGLQMPLSYFKVNYVNVRGEAHMVWGVACRAGAMSSPQGLRAARMQMMRKAYLVANKGRVIARPHAGWHFSYLGDADHVRTKIQAFVHQEVNRPDTIDHLDLDAIMKSGADIFQRENYAWEVVPISDYFPERIVSDRERYRHLIAETPIGGGGRAPRRPSRQPNCVSMVPESDTFRPLSSTFNRVTTPSLTSIE